MRLRFHERDYRWIAFDTWTYALTFNTPANVAAAKHAVLVLRGVDTFANGAASSPPTPRLSTRNLRPPVRATPAALP